jgi:hypothetical protein
MKSATKEGILQLISAAKELKTPVVFEHYNFEDLDLSGLDFSNVTFRKSNFVSCSFNKSKFFRSRIDTCTINKCSFVAAILDQAQLFKVTMTDTVLDNASMFAGSINNSKFGSCSIKSTSFVGADIHNLKLYGTFGLRTNEEWIENHCETTSEGIICYLMLGSWDYRGWNKKKPGDSVKSPNINADITEGHIGEIEVFASKKVVEHYLFDPNSRDFPDVWKCLIPWNKTLDVVVPLASDGYFRTGYLTFLEKIPYECPEEIYN